MKTLILLALIIAGCQSVPTPPPAPLPTPAQRIQTAIANWEAFVAFNKVEMAKLNWSAERLMWKRFEPIVKSVQYLSDVAIKNPTANNVQVLEAEVTADMSRNWLDATNL